MPDHLQAELDELREQYERTREGLAGLTAALARVCATVRSPDGSVRAVVGARGQLQSLTLSERAYRLHTPTRLAELIMDTVSRATAEAATQMAELMAPYLPQGLDHEQVFGVIQDPATLLPSVPPALR
jgi:DNA-binding protein YbaB